MKEIVRKLSEYVIFENDRYLLVKINNYLSNYNMVMSIDNKSRWCTLSKDSFKNLTDIGYLLRLYDSKINKLYSIYILEKDKQIIKHIVDTQHKHHEKLLKEWNIPFLINLQLFEYKKH